MLLKSGSRFVGIGVGMLANPITIFANDVRCSLERIDNLKDLSLVGRGFFGFECEAEV